MNIFHCAQPRAFMNDVAYWGPDPIDMRIPAVNPAYDTYANYGYDMVGVDPDMNRIPDSVIATLPGGGALVIQMPVLPKGPEFLPFNEAQAVTRIPQSGQLQVKGRGNPLYRDPGYGQQYANLLDCAPGMATSRAKTNQDRLWGPELDDDTKRLVLERPMPSIVRATVFPDEVTEIVPSQGNTALWLVAGVVALAMLSN